MLDRSLQNAHKVAYLVKSYPEKKLTELKEVNGRQEEIGIAGMVEVSIIEFNAAVWRADELGLIELAADKSGDVRFVSEPKDGWQFGEDVEVLVQDIQYTLKKFAESETDMEGNYLSNWTLGHAPHDIFVAVKYLIEKDLVKEYELTTKVEIPVESKKARGRGAKPKQSKQTYQFYTLPENLEKQWGRKMFPDQSKLVD